jgi:hypothetical protein
MTKRLTVFTVAILVAVATCLLAAHAQPTATIALPDPGGTKELYAGCNPVALTFPNGTSSQTVANAVSPAGSIQAIWSYDPGQQRFTAFSPTAPQASDLLTVNFLDAVWVCIASAPSPPAATAPMVAPPTMSATAPSHDDLVAEVYSYGVTGPCPIPNRPVGCEPPTCSVPTIDCQPGAWFYVHFDNLNPTWSVCGLVFRVDVLDTGSGMWVEGEEIQVGTLEPLEAVDWPRQSIVNGVTGVQDYRIMADWAWC